MRGAAETGARAAPGGPRHLGRGPLAAVTALGSVLTDLVLACDELNRRGWSARVTDDPAPRLVVRHELSRVCAELLPPAGDASYDRWSAVRLSSGRRTAWRGPQRSEVVTGLDLLPFVRDLVTLAEPDLAGRYRPQKQRR